MTFVDAVRTCFSKYAVFGGRAARSEYWYWALFNLLVGLVTGGISVAVGLGRTHLGIGSLIDLLVLLPGLAVAVRRLHDIDRSGWWLLVTLVPVVGWLILLVWNCTRGTSGLNRFGPDPLMAVAGWR